MSPHNNAVLPARTPAKPHSGEVALEVCDLVKTYPGPRGGAPVRALDQLSIRVAAGTIFGLLGPNGAGKSTTVKILTTLSRPDSGDARVAGIDVVRYPGQVRREIGLVAQKASSDPMATGRENLLLAARIQGLSRRAAATRAGELLDRFGLTDAANRLVRTYSGGMARAWMSRSDWFTARRCSSSTNPRPGSTRRPGPRCGPRSKGSPTSR